MATSASLQYTFVGRISAIEAIRAPVGQAGTIDCGELRPLDQEEGLCTVEGFSREDAFASNALADSYSHFGITGALWWTWKMEAYENQSSIQEKNLGTRSRASPSSSALFDQFTICTV